MVTVREADVDDPAALDALVRFVAADPTLGQLVGVDRIERAAADERAAILDDVRNALRSIVASKPAYHCSECGYSCLGLQWQCPGCRAWETVRPEVRIRLT